MCLSSELFYRGFHVLISEAMCCEKETRTKCYMAFFTVCYQLIFMTFLCMVVSYLRLVLLASYFHVALVLCSSILVDSFLSWLLRCFTCCERPGERIFIVQVLISVAVMIGSSMVFFTIHVWSDVTSGDLNIYTILVAISVL